MNKTLTLVAMLLLGCGASMEPSAPQTCSSPPTACSQVVDSPIDTSFAIDGDGWFVLNERTGVRYTRLGQFHVDDEGHLASRSGALVRGVDGVLTVRPEWVPPRATSRVEVRSNLDSRTTVSATAFDPSSPATTSDFQTSTTVFDSLGAAHTVDLFYKRSAAGWEWHALTDGGGVQGGTAGVPTEISAGALMFDANGALLASAQASAPVFSPLGATQPQPLTFDFGSGTSGLTQFGSASSNSFISQDGAGAGQLATVEAQSDGTLLGRYSNGHVLSFGRLALANFALSRALSTAGDDVFAESAHSGPPLFGAPLDLNFGSLRWHALEVPCDQL